MAGVNPYIVPVQAAKAKQPFRVTFVDEESGAERVVPVDPATFEFGHLGLDGSLLDIAHEAGVEINHSCGGVCACSTCHVHVQQGLESCSKSTDDEEDELDKAPGLSPESRLACQCVPNGTKDLVVLIPKWNRNQVKEGHH
ncbi:MAG: 2Fe-2S iron-sulfur cluster-binding protein [Gemmataceae bacterium]